MFKKSLAIIFATSAIFGSLQSLASADLTVVRMENIYTREVEDKLIVSWRGSIQFDHYNLKWSRTGKAEKIVTELNKRAVDKRIGSYYIKNPIPDTDYVFEVQGCEVSRVNNQAKCTQWKKTFHKTNPQVASNNLPYGPETCKQGFVWREATDGDKVCVTPATRARVRADNAQAANRREPNGGAYGPDTCKQGYVWRETIPSDHVCVTPAERSAAAEDNSRASDRRVKP
jgi:hypothetical protein